MADLILPGTIPGLLRVCALIAIASGAFAGRKGVIVDLEPGARHAVVALQADAQHDASVEWLPLANLALDLTDATGRAHAAWWLEGQAPRWRTMMAGRLGGEMLRLLECVETHKFLGSDEREARGRVRLVLNGLDPNDPRHLPDGSRWVDAEALRRVVLHVAGVDRG